MEQVSRIWSDVAPHVGYDPKEYELSIVRHRTQEKSARIVVQLQDAYGPALILKHDLVAGHINHFRNGVEAHKRALTVFAGHDNLHVPDLIHVDEDRRVLVMEYAQGDTAFDAMRFALMPQDRSNILRSCGKWVGYWHRQTYQRENTINPDTMKSHLSGQRDRVESGELKVAKPDEFVGLSNKTIKMAEAARGHTTRLAATHGDLNLRNLVLGPNGVYGLDFGAVHDAPIGHDLARFIINFASFYFPDGTSSKTIDWLLQDITDFFEGYGSEHRDDPSFNYLMRSQLLKEWLTIPKSVGARNGVHQRRWKGIKLLSSLLF